MGVLYSDLEKRKRNIKEKKIQNTVVTPENDNNTSTDNYVASEHNHNNNEPSAHNHNNNEPSAHNRNNNEPPAHNRNNYEPSAHNRRKNYILKEGTPIPPLVDMGYLQKKAKLSAPCTINSSKLTALLK